VVLTKSKFVARAMEPDGIKELIKEGRRVFLTSNVKESIGKAYKLAEAEDMILITGSLFIVGEAREILIGAFNEAYPESI